LTDTLERVKLNSFGRDFVVWQTSPPLNARPQLRTKGDDMRKITASLMLAVVMLVSGDDFVAAKKGGGHRSRVVALSESDLTQIANSITKQSICTVILRFFKPKVDSNQSCDPLDYTFDDSKKIYANLSASGDPGFRRFLLDLRGSSELLANTRPGGAESHKLDILFMLDFDGKTYVHIFDIEPRLSARKPDASSDTDYNLMDRIYDTPNQDFILRFADAVSDYFSDEKNVDMDTALSR
jgi:hypothetical protein